MKDKTTSAEGGKAGECDDLKNVYEQEGVINSISHFLMFQKDED